MAFELRAYPGPEIQDVERRMVGPFIVGVSLQALLFGILAAQYWWIVTKAQCRPSRNLHWFLGIVTLLNAAHCGCNIAMLWQIVLDFVAAAPQRSQISSPATVLSAWLYSLIQGCCTCFFARRSFIATGRSIWSGAIMTLLVGAFLCTAVVTECRNSYNFAHGGSFVDSRKYHAATMCLNAVGDVAISGILIRKISEQDLLQYRQIARRIVIFVLTTATLTTILAISQVAVLLTTWGTSAAFVGISLVLPRISAICVCTSVIARDRLAESATQETPSEVVQRFRCGDSGHCDIETAVPKEVGPVPHTSWAQEETKESDTLWTDSACS